MSVTRIAAQWVLCATLTVASLSCVGGPLTDTTPNGLAYLNVALKATILRVGDKTTGSVSFRNASGVNLTARAVTWNSSNSSVAKVSPDGEITAMAEGSTVISVSSDGKSAAANLTVSGLSPDATPVASISIAFDLAGLHAGEQAQASAVARDDEGNVLTGRPVTWTSSDPTVATVSSTGVVTAVGPGTVTITATTEGASSSVTFTILPPIPEVVASVIVTIAVTSLLPGQSTPAMVLVRDAGGRTLTDRVVTWASTNTNVAVVNASGLVTALTPGIANIVASSEGHSDDVTLTVVAVAPPPAPPAPTQPSPDSVATVVTSLVVATLQPGQVTLASALLRNGTGVVMSGNVTWTSSNTAIATVSNSGVVTAVAPGDADIEASSNNGKKGKSKLTVQAAPPVAVSTVTVSLASPQRNPGQTTQATAVMRDANGNALTGRVVTWATSNAAVASVSSNGAVTAVGVGTANIVATSEGKSGSAAITVTAPPPAPVATVSVSLATSSVLPGATTQASAVTRDAGGFVLTGRAITWSSSNTAVATVSSSGLVTAIAPGSAAITATSETKVGSATLTVQPMPVNSVTVSIASSTFQVGQTSQATAVTRDASGTTVTGRVITWSSSNSAIATVASSGLVTGVGVGSATITATSETKTGSVGVTVQAAPPPPPPAPVATVTVSLVSSSLLSGQTTQAAAVARDASNNILTGRSVTWSSSNTSVATVSSSGLVTAVSAGTANIVATVETKTGSALATVTATVGAPGAVTNLSATATSSSIISLSFTQVGDGAGTAASYEVRSDVAPISWGSATNVASGTCDVPLAGTATSGTLSCTVTGLSPNTTYEFQLVAFRGTLNAGAVFGSLSNIASATTPAGAVASVAVSPSTPSISVGATVALTATARDAASNTLPCSPAWSSANTAIATVNSSGGVSGVAAGTVTITATCAGISGTASITVSATPVTPVVTTVTVAPSAATINVGATQALTATVRDQNGATMTGQTVSWASSSSAIATVSGSGVVTGVAAGTATITATVSGKSDDASVTVSAPQPPPPPGTSAEPAGMTRIDELTFASMPGGPWEPQGNGRIVQDATEPLSSSGAVDFTIAAGTRSGGASGQIGRSGYSARQLYFRSSIWISPSFRGESSGCNKLLIAWTGGKPTVVFSATGSGTGPLRPQMRLQDNASGNHDANVVPGAEMQRGVWNVVEVLVDIPGSRIQWWLNGVLVGNISVSIGGGTSSTFEINPIWGGNSGNVAPEAMSVRFGHLYMSGKS